MRFKHFVVTRFNMPIFPTRNNGDEVKNNDVGFLNKRLDIFERYCMPSLRKQTCQDFQWLVMFDINTPQVIKERLVHVEESMANMSVCYFDLDRYSVLSQEYIDLYNDYVQKVPYKPQKIASENYQVDSELIQRCCTPKYIGDLIREKTQGDAYDYIITTRIDNDDAFHKDMIETVQRLAVAEIAANQGGGKLLINFVYGFQMLLQSRVVQRFKSYNNHFTSLIEPQGAIIQTAFYWDHRYADKFVDIVNIKTKPLWLELLHGNNVANGFDFSYGNSCIKGYLLFNCNNFGYAGLKASLRATMRKMFSWALIVGRLRSLKHELLKI